MRTFKAITFDFWGTLVDVDTSGEAGVAAVLAQSGVTPGMTAKELYFKWDDATVRRYRSGTWRPYFDFALLGLQDVLQPLGFDAGPERWAALTETLLSTMTGEARPHPEVPAIIAVLKEKYPLMPITNMDNRLFDLNPFRSEFAQVTTAEEARAFKPSAFIFQRAIEKLGVPADQILHVSLSQFADLEGAMPMGMQVAWINRYGHPLGQFTPKPLYEFSDLSGLKGVLAGDW
ncbi:HAD family hydrolase [Pseudomonas sp. SLFW]|uniref:HAD family hydrolase n=1 Tax=Pseudomonas sp. SLFW TaxID=2683259 RepID=UPI00141347DB|nr:HAD family hydrolase [Pseudomonas sp. SLFW]NBB13151.1 HAD hydrolase-like protein [Pseudomonas sp. SLFW]